jgi:choice-of-anchor C domain-containing protein
MKKTLWVAAVCVLMAAPINADMITNGSFEEGTDPGSFTTLGGGSTAITGWTVVGADKAIDYIGTYWQAADGVRSLDLNGDFQTGGVEQTFATQSGQKYLVTFDLAGNPDSGPALKEMDVIMAIGDTPQQTWSFDFDITSKDKQNMGWTKESFVFTADSEFTTLRFLSTMTGAFGPALDNVSVNAVPLPASVLLGVFAVGLAGRKLRKLV